MSRPGETTLDNVRAIVVAEREDRNDALRELDASAARYVEKTERRIADAKAMPPKVLVVEDNKPFRELLARLYSRDLNAVVDLCDTVEEAALRVRAHAYDLVVVDLHLAEGGDGVQVIRDIRERSLRPMVKILVVSGVVDEGHGEEVARLAGAHEFIAKPAENASFVSAARRLLKVL